MPKGTLSFNTSCRLSPTTTSQPLAATMRRQAGGGEQPDVPEVVADPRQPSGHLGDPRQGRQVGVEPCATAPASRARSTCRQSASESREGRPQRPGPASPTRPPWCRRACQWLAVWREPEGAGDLGPDRPLEQVGLQTAPPGGGGRSGMQAAWTSTLRQDHCLTTHETDEHHIIPELCNLSEDLVRGLPQLMPSEPGRTPGFAC
jgi:hypothetical protein